MGLRSFIRTAKRVLKVTRKPTRGSFKISLRVCFVTTALLGIIGFIIQFVSSILQTLRVPPIPRETILYILIFALVITLAIMAYRRRKGRL